MVKRAPDEVVSYDSFSGRLNLKKSPKISILLKFFLNLPSAVFMTSVILLVCLFDWSIYIYNLSNRISSNYS